MDVMEGRTVFAFAAHELRDLLIHLPRAEAAPARDDQGLVAEAERLPGLLAFGVEEFLPHGRAGQEDLFGVGIVLAAGVEGDHDAAGRARDELRGEARDGVRLMHAGGDAELRAHLERGEAGVAASTDDDVGPEVLQDALRFGKRRGHALHGHEIVPDGGGGQLSLVVGDLHGLQLEALARDELVFHAVLRADEEDPAVRLALAEHAGDRDGGIDMSAGAAAGKDDVHRLSPFALQEFIVVLPGHGQDDTGLKQLHEQRRAAIGEERE